MGHVRELHMYLNLKEAQTFSPSDMLERYASINPGVEFVPGDGREDMLMIDGMKYSFDHFEKFVLGIDLVAINLFVKIKTRAKETIDSLISEAAAAAKEVNREKEASTRDLERM